MEEPVDEKIRIVMSLRRLKAVDEATAEVIKVAKGMGLKVWGPCRAPTQIVDIKTGLAPYSKVAAAVVGDAKGMHLRICGPSVLPNWVMNITTRLTAQVGAKIGTSKSLKRSFCSL